MRRFTVACAQMGFKPNDVGYNLERHLNNFSSGGDPRAEANRCKRFGRRF